jgi:chemotaxis protein methyltransferase CheR
MTQVVNQKVILNDMDYARFRDLVLERSGLHFPEHKRIDLEVGLSKALIESAMISSKNDFDINQYYVLLRDTSNPLGQAEMGRLINILTVGETYFFRDEAQFNGLTNHVLPLLLDRKRLDAMAKGTVPRLRIWSAGCASGEEPYSLAMLLKEILPDLNRWEILILGTDINHDVLKRAETARYSSWSFREERAKNIQSTYFTSDDKTRYFQLREDIRKMVTFTHLNLIEDSYPNLYKNVIDMDLIICRNVTIYFKQDTTQKVINRFYNTLVKGGWLVVGHAESSLSTYRAFEVRSFPGAIFYQKTGKPTNLMNWGILTEDGKPEMPLPKMIPQRIVIDRQPVQLPTEQSPAKVDDYELAQSLLDKGNTYGAVTKLKQKITSDPKFAPAHSLLGHAYANLGRWDEAKQACEQAIKLNQLLTDAYLTLALVYQNENKIDLAIDHLKKATYLDHKNPLTYFNLGMLYNKNGQTSQAKRAFQVVVKILEKWPANKVVPGTEGEIAQRLLRVSQQMLNL